MTTGHAGSETEATGMLPHARDWQIAFTIADQTYRWTDVVLYAMRSGAWAELEAQVREGLACEAHARATQTDPELSELYGAADAFRHPRGLLSLEQLVAWLEQWGLSAESWLACVKRSLLRRRSAAKASGLAAKYPVSDQALAGVMWAEAVCSGLLSRSAAELAERASDASAQHSLESRERTPDSDPIVQKLRAHGLGGWALCDCRDRLDRLAALERSAGHAPGRALTDAMMPCSDWTLAGDDPAPELPQQLAADPERILSLAV